MIDGSTDPVTGLVQEYGRMVFTCAHRILGEPSGAEDVLQNVFLKVLKLKPAKRESVTEWGAYLRVLTTREAIDQLRRNARREDSLVFPDQSPGSPDDHPHHQLDRAEKSRRLRQMLKKISAKDARVFVLRYFEDMSYEDIARSLDMSVNKVGVVLHRVRARLKDQLSQDRSAFGAPQLGKQGGVS